METTNTTNNSIPSTDDIINAINAAKAAQGPAGATAEAQLDAAIQQATLLNARQRANRPTPVITLATDSDQMTLHVDYLRVVACAAGITLVAVAGYGLVLLTKIGAKWVASKVGV